MQEVVEVSDTGGLTETSCDAAVCLEETVDASGMPDGSSVTAAASLRDEELRAKPASSVDAVQQTGISSTLFVLGLVILCLGYFLFVIISLSVPVQSIAWKASSPK